MKRTWKNDDQNQKPRRSLRLQRTETEESFEIEQSVEMDQEVTELDGRKKRAYNRRQNTRNNAAENQINEDISQANGEEVVAENGEKLNTCKRKLANEQVGKANEEEGLSANTIVKKRRGRPPKTSSAPQVLKETKIIAESSREAFNSFWKNEGIPQKPIIKLLTMSAKPKDSTASQSIAFLPLILALPQSKNESGSSTVVVQSDHGSSSKKTVKNPATIASFQPIEIEQRKSEKSMAPKTSLDKTDVAPMENVTAAEQTLSNSGSFTRNRENETEFKFRQLPTIESAFFQNTSLYFGNETSNLLYSPPVSNTSIYASSQNVPKIENVEVVEANTFSCPTMKTRSQRSETSGCEKVLEETKLFPMQHVSKSTSKTNTLESESSVKNDKFQFSIIEDSECMTDSPLEPLQTEQIDSESVQDKSLHLEGKIATISVVHVSPSVENESDNSVITERMFDFDSPPVIQSAPVRYEQVCNTQTNAVKPLSSVELLYTTLMNSSDNIRKAISQQSLENPARDELLLANQPEPFLHENSVLEETFSESVENTENLLENDSSLPPSVQHSPKIINNRDDDSSITSIENFQVTTPPSENKNKIQISENSEMNVFQQVVNEPLVECFTDNFEDISKNMVDEIGTEHYLQSQVQNESIQEVPSDFEIAVISSVGPDDDYADDSEPLKRNTSNSSVAALITTTNENFEVNTLQLDNRMETLGSEKAEVNLIQSEDDELFGAITTTYSEDTFQANAESLQSENQCGSLQDKLMNSETIGVIVLPSDVNEPLILERYNSPTAGLKQMDDFARNPEDVSKVVNIENYAVDVNTLSHSENQTELILREKVSCLQANENLLREANDDESLLDKSLEPPSEAKISVHSTDQLEDSFDLNTNEESFGDTPTPETCRPPSQFLNIVTPNNELKMLEASERINNVTSFEVTEGIYFEKSPQFFKAERNMPQLSRYTHLSEPKKIKVKNITTYKKNKAHLEEVEKNYKQYIEKIGELEGIIKTLSYFMKEEGMDICLNSGIFNKQLEILKEGLREIDNHQSVNAALKQKRADWHQSRESIINDENFEKFVSYFDRFLISWIPLERHVPMGRENIRIHTKIGIYINEQFEYWEINEQLYNILEKFGEDKLKYRQMRKNGKAKDVICELSKLINIHSFDNFFVMRNKYLEHELFKKKLDRWEEELNESMKRKSENIRTFLNQIRELPTA